MIEIFAVAGVYAMLLLGMTVFIEDTSFEEAYRKVVKVAQRGIKGFMDVIKRNVLHKFHFTLIR